MKAAGLGVEAEGPEQVEIAAAPPGVDARQRPRAATRLRHRGRACPWRARRCAQRRRCHAEKNVARGVDVIIAQGTEAGGHTGEISTMVLVPEVVDTVGPDVPVLAAGGIGCGRQMAAAMALGARGAWTGSIWLTVAEADDAALGGREAARRGLRRHRALPFHDRQAGAPAPHRLDRGLGRPRRTRHASHAAPGHPLRPLPRTGSCACARRSCRGRPPVRSSVACTRCGRRARWCSTSSTSGSRPTSASRPASSRPDPTPP